MAKEYTLALEAQFSKECKVIDLRYEYPGYTGTEKYGIITALSQDELIEIYGNLISKYTPFLLLNEAFGLVRADFKRNNDKFLKRSLLDHQYSIDDEFEEHHSQFSIPDFSDAIIAKWSGDSPVTVALRSLTDLQREYVYRHIIDGVSLLQIAKEYNKNAKTVSESYHAAIRKMKRILENTPQFRLANSEQVKGLVSDPDGNAFQTTN